MAKSVLKQNEFTDYANIEFIKIPNVSFESGLENVEAEESLLEATMKIKLEEFEKQFAQEKQTLRQSLEEERIRLVESAQEEAQKLLDDARKELAGREQETEEKVASLLEEAQKEKEALLQEAQSHKEKVVLEADARVEEIHEEARSAGFEEGYEDAYRKGEEQLDRLFENIQSIADHLLDRRQKILQDSQAQLTAILLSAVRKIVYKISESQEDLIIKTLNEVMLRITSQSDIILRVNAQDMSLVEEWTPRLQERFKALKSIQVFQDSTVEQGGCVVETDFGDIDARIATRISRMEDKILEINSILSL